VSRYGQKYGFVHNKCLSGLYVNLAAAVFFYIRLLGMLREDLLKHMSPLEWEHINFLGEYRVDPKGITTLESLRQLNQG
jgi:hypothetical protein